VKKKIGSLSSSLNLELLVKNSFATDSEESKMDPKEKREKKSDKQKKTYELFGKNTPKGVRIKTDMINKHLKDIQDR
jgi:hypothetical protein